MNIFIFEHLCSGIMGDEPLAEHLLMQGRSMWTAAIKDFQRAGFCVRTIIAPQLASPCDHIETYLGKTPKQVVELFDQLVLKSDAALIIAPESENILLNWTTRLADNKIQNLGCNLSAIELCTNKLALAKHFKAHHIATPKTALWTTQNAFDLPHIIKPRDGVGCEDTFLCISKNQQAQTPAHFSEPMVVQPYHEGIAVSCSLLISANQTQILPSGYQLIENNQNRLVYVGGQFPLPDHLANRAASLAKQAAATVAGLRGYVGIDIVLGQCASDDLVIEINPRLTLSYIGLQQLCIDNIGLAMIDPKAPLNWQHCAIHFNAKGIFQKELA